MAGSTVECRVLDREIRRRTRQNWARLHMTQDERDRNKDAVSLLDTDVTTCKYRSD